MRIQKVFGRDKLFFNVPQISSFNPPPFTCQSRRVQMATVRDRVPLHALHTSLIISCQHLFPVMWCVCARLLLLVSVLHTETKQQQTSCIELIGADAITRSAGMAWVTVTVLCDGGHTHCVISSRKTRKAKDFKETKNLDTQGLRIT